MSATQKSSFEARTHLCGNSYDRGDDFYFPLSRLRAYTFSRIYSKTEVITLLIIYTCNNAVYERPEKFLSKTFLNISGITINIINLKVK